MVEHQVIINSVGGATVLSCASLGITNIEYVYDEITAQGIKETILHHKFMTEAEAKFDLVIIDNRPEPEDYNEKRAQESKQFNKNNNTLFTSKMLPK